MAQYKVIQDIEAEDKLLGPLSLRQFIYAGFAAFMGWLSFIAVTKHAAFLLAGFVPPMLFCMFFAWPWSPDQPTEVWALARIRFYFKPRKRIWDQTGARDLVTITAPKRIEKVYTNGLSQNEVRSRLTALADTIDSRGWAIKNANVTMPALPGLSDDSDRLVMTSAIPQPVADADVTASDDIMDAQNNPIAHQFDTMIQQASAVHRQEIMERMQSTNAQAPSSAPAAANQSQLAPDYWFLHEQNGPVASQAAADAVVFANPQVVQPGSQGIGPVAAVPTPSEEALAHELHEQAAHKRPVPTMHLRTINPLGSAPISDAPMVAPIDAADSTPQPTPAMTAASDAAILNLANNNDLDVATIARQAERARHPDSDDEVVISLR